MSLDLFKVDAFTDTPFRGNPAAVCLLPAPAPAEWMQKVAFEMNLAETAFVHPHAGGGFALRWFTPAAEVALCGHATLATAHVLWSTGRLERATPARFETRSGWLTADWHDPVIELDFPSKPAEEIREAPDGLLAALQVEPIFVGRSEFDYLLQVASETEVRAVKPDFARLAELPVRGTIVTSRGEEGTYDFVSRFFAPAVGVPEDPVTGSAHCTLTPFWSQRLGKDELLAYQASARGGELRLRLVGDRVKLGGRAVTILEGKLLTSP